MIFAISYLAYFVQQDQFSILLIGYAIAFLAFAKIYKHAQEYGSVFKNLIFLAIFLRLLLLFSFPMLSDDIYRFLWDGHLIGLGINPLIDTPSVIMNSEHLADSYLQQLYPKLNSPDYHTIYPPFSQLIFYVIGLCDSFSVEQSVLALKVILLGFEGASLYLMGLMLNYLKLSRVNLLLYALNPLVIVELMGNVHFEGIMVFFTLLSLYCLFRFRFPASALSFSLGVASKLLPLMFLPAIIAFLRKRKKEKGWLAAVIAITIVSFIPFFYDLNVLNFLSSVDLYFQKFEFNASIYYVLSWIFKLLTGYNQIWIIGPVLGGIALIWIVKHSFNQDYTTDLNLINSLFYAFICYLLLATTVHPWYLILPIALCVFNPRFWLLAWSFLVVLSYAYYDGDFLLPWWSLLIVEYLLVGYFWYRAKKIPATN